MKKTEGQRNATVLYRDLFILPENPAPTKTRCIQLIIPDDDQHMAAFLGAIQLLSKWNSWQRDDAHKGTLAAQTWQGVLNSQKIFEACQTRPIIITEEVDDMGIRVDCDCNVWITCCDGTEKQLLTSQQVKDLINGTTPGNAPQPPAGGCQKYSGSLAGQAQWLVPTPVSTGDTVEIQNGLGSSNGDGLARWNCTDGSQYFGGACLSAYPHTDAGALMPGVPIGTLIVNIDGGWYDGRSIITVPGGVSAIQPTVALNYDLTYPVNGDRVSFDVNVCNNTTTFWCYEFDFRLSDFASIWGLQAGEGGAYSVGVGYISTSGSPNAVLIKATLPTGSYTSYTVEFSADGGGSYYVYQEGSTVDGGSLSAGVVSIVYSAAITLPAELKAQAFGGNNYTIPRIVLVGTGVNPFGSTNC